MLRTLLLCVLVVGAAVALAIGSYSALAGTGPVTSVASAVIGADEPDDGDVVEGADDVDGDDVDAEDDDDVDGVVAQQDGEGGQAKGARHIASLIEAEDAFGAQEGSVWALHEQGIGFGALFKLYALGVSIPTDADGDYEFNFGKLRKALTEEQQAVLESGPKNLGKLVSAANHEDNGGAGGVTAQGGGQGHAFGRGHGHGLPESVPAHGRN